MSAEEEGFIVVRSPQELLQERVQQLINTNGVLEYSKRALEQQLMQITTEVNELRKLKAEYEDKLNASDDELKRVIEKLKSSEELCASVNEQLEKTEHELAEQKKIRVDQDNHLEMTQDELSRVSGTLKCYEVKERSIEKQLELRDQEIIDLTKRTADQQLMIDDFKSKVAIRDAEIELGRTTLAKVMSERRDLEAENKMLRNEMEDVKAKCDTLEANKDLMMHEILDLEKIKLKSKVDVKVMMECMDEVNKKMCETEEKQNSMSREWKKKEEEMQKQLDEMKIRLAQAADEYQKLYKYNTKLEAKIERIKSKVKHYFDAKSQSKVASNDMSPVEQQEQLSAAETAVKTVIDASDMTEELNRLREEFNALDVHINNTSANDGERANGSIAIITLPCCVCREEVTCTAVDLSPMTLHLEEKHSQRLCPVCSMLFDTKMRGADQYFQMHVENHFDVPQYPPEPDIRNDPFL